MTRKSTEEVKAEIEALKKKIDDLMDTNKEKLKEIINNDSRN